MGVRNERFTSRKRKGHTSVTKALSPFSSLGENRVLLLKTVNYIWNHRAWKNPAFVNTLPDVTSKLYPPPLMKQNFEIGLLFINPLWFWNKCLDWQSCLSLISGNKYITCELSILETSNLICFSRSFPVHWSRDMRFLRQGNHCQRSSFKRVLH